MAEPSRRAGRGGGRAARVAMRQAPPTEDKLAVWPGHVGGAFRPLTESDCQSVFDTALSLLEEVGMGQAVPEIIDVVTAAGGWMDEHDRLRYPRDLVLGGIDTAAKSWVWHGVDDDRSIELADSKVHFGTAGAAVFMFDHDTQEYRPSTTRDLFDVARLVDTLDNIHFFVRTVVTRDLEDARAIDINTAYACVAGTTKPIGTSFFAAEHVADAVDLFDTLMGGEGEFAKRPFCVANNTFVVPPLRFAEESAKCLLAEVHAGMPINLLSAGQAGATSPAALAGSLTQALAECLAGLTTVNLLRPGHPCVMGLWPFVSDLRTGSMSGGSGEEAVLNAAAAQVANWLGLPSGVAAGMADSKLPDNQAGHEKALTVALAADAGANLVYESAGMLGSILGCSLEALVIDNDMHGAINRTVRGVEVTPETLSADTIRRVVFGDGHYLGDAQTLSMMQTEYTYPVVGDRQSPQDWADDGKLSVVDRAHAHVVEVLSAPPRQLIPDDVDAAIRSRHPIVL